MNTRSALDYLEDAIAWAAFILLELTVVMTAVWTIQYAWKNDKGWSIWMILVITILLVGIIAWRCLPELMQRWNEWRMYRESALRREAVRTYTKKDIALDELFRVISLGLLALGAFVGTEPTINHYLGITEENDNSGYWWSCGYILIAFMVAFYRKWRLR